MTTLTAKAFNDLTALITGKPAGRVATREAAEARFRREAAKAAIEADLILAHGSAYDCAKALGGDLEALSQSRAREEAAALKVAAPSARRAALMLIEADAPAQAAKPARTKKAPTAKERGKRASAKAEAMTAAAAGIVPEAPDMSAPSHKPFLKALANIKAMVAARDLAGLKADPMEPKSSSRLMICRYRDLAIIAIEARGQEAAA